MTSFDIVIIGSGAGGSPIAERAAAAGAKVLVIERGKALPRAGFDRDEILLGDVSINIRLMTAELEAT